MTTRTQDFEGPGGLGAVTVQAPKEVGERFEAAVNKHQSEHTTSDVPLDGTHRSGMEPVAERARDMNDVAKAKVRGEETRTPDVGFPSK